MTDTAAPPVPFGRQLGETARASRHLLNAVLARSETTFERWVALNVLAIQGGAVRRDRLQRELAEGLGSDTSAIAALLAELADDDLIVERVVPGEPDAKQIGLTEQGRALYRRLADTVARTTAQVLSGLDPDDVRVASRVLAQVKERASALRGD
jgi:MarR family transcriptional regulator, transcriptional regulator for hemolysin